MSATDPDRVRPWVIPLTSAPEQPPLTGGTLLVTADGASAVVSDPDHARLVVVDLVARSVRGEIALEPSDEPGRSAQDDAGRVYVALRRGGALLTIDPATARVVERRAVCAQPRGVAYDPDRDRILVACAEGELVALPRAGTEGLTRMNVDRDLRDVAVRGNRIYVSRFRSADVLVLDPAGAVVTRFPGDGARSVAWRMVVSPAGAVVLLHQSATATAVEVTAGGYGGSSESVRRTCAGPIVMAAVTVLGSTPELTRSSTLVPNGLAIDLALSSTGTTLTVAVPGNWGRADAAAWVDLSFASVGATGCARDPGSPPASPASRESNEASGQVVAVAALPSGGMILQTRAPASLLFARGLARIPLGGGAAADTGHRMFHTNPGGSITCASCHPEGGDDGRTWDFVGVGLRRTPMLRGGMLGSEPFHWDGELRDFAHLVDDVLVVRMGAPRPTAAQVEHLARWVDRLPALVAPTRPADAVLRGERLFVHSDVGCAGCHGGAHLTNNQSVDVGTRGIFQVPSLVGLRWRAPYLHDGCAPTLHDRFGPCGGGDRHGRTSQLSNREIDDLVTYLETL